MRSRPLTEVEIDATLKALPTDRDRALFILGCRTGFRISELLSLRWRDVLAFNKISIFVYVARQNVKGKLAGQRIPLHKEAREALKKLDQRREHPSVINYPNTEFIFRADKGLNRPLDRKTYWRIITKAFEEARVHGAGGTHAMRKTFAQRVYERLGKDLRATQKAMRHKSIESTIHYLQEIDSELVNAAILGGE